MQTIFFFCIWSIWEEKNYLKLHSSFQVWELHANNPHNAHGFGKYQKQDFVYEDQARYAAKKFFTEASNDSLSRAHSVYEGTTVLFYDYLSTFESTKEKVRKVFQFLNSLNLGRIGSQARQEFLDEQDELMDDRSDNNIDEEILANIEIGE